MGTSRVVLETVSAVQWRKKAWQVVILNRLKQVEELCKQSRAWIPSLPMMERWLAAEIVLSTAILLLAAMKTKALAACTTVTTSKSERTPSY